MDTPKYLTDLRQATRPSHDALEQLTEGGKLMDDQPDLNIYKKLLATHYRFHLEVSRQVKSHNIEVLDWPECNRIAALKNDLDQLNIDANNQDITLPISSPSFAIGLCYVSEGSCMGNQMMLNSLKDNSTFQSWQADHFLSSCKESFGERWKDFKAIMQPYGESDYASLEAGALAGFDLFAQLWKSEVSRNNMLIE
ncbi:MAG: biliverdin-producing heme oxygenase [Bacteroidota bacterium]